MGKENNSQRTTAPLYKNKTKSSTKEVVIVSVITILFSIGFIVADSYAASKGADPAAFPRHCEEIPSPVIARPAKQAEAISRQARNRLRNLRDCFARLRSLAMTARSVIASLPKAGEAISDWLLPSAYAASKGAEAVAHWRFDEGGGPTAYDESSNNSDGTLSAGAAGSNTAAGQMWSRQGKVGAAVEFDGTDDYVEMPGPSSGQIAGDKLTIELWAKPSSVSGSQYIVQKNGPFFLYLSGNKLGGGINTSGGWTYAGGNISLSVNNWYHLAVVYDGSNINLYVNGAFDNSAAKSGAMSGNGCVQIGQWTPGNCGTTGASSWFQGLTDDVKIYNYARSAEQILVDYNAGKAVYLGAGTDPNEGNPPAAYWPLDENTGSTAYDKSGNGHDAALTASPIWANGKNGSALSFDGTTNQYAGVSSGMPAQGNTITVEAWVYPTAISDAGADRNNFIYSGYYMALGGHKLNVYTSGTSNEGWHTSNGSVCEGAWQHMAFTYDGSNMRMYINGALDKTVAMTGNISSVASLNIGRRPDSAANPYLMQGKIDDVRIYNYARSAAQIAYDHNKGAPVAHYKFDEGGGAIAHNEYSSADSGTAPIGWWRMDEGVGTSVADASGNGYTGTLGATTTWVTGKIGPYALNADAANEWMQLSSSISLNGISYTIEAWSEFPLPVASDGWRTLTRGVNNDHQVLVRSDGVLGAYDNAGGTGFHSSGYDIDGLSSGWHHIAAVGSGSSTTFYIDSVSVGTSDFKSNAEITHIGNLYAGNQWWGKFDDVRIYNYARTQEQIYNDYKTTHGTLVADTRFTDGKIGKALQFDGVGDYVLIDVDSWIRKCSYITISGWYYHTADTDGAPWGIITNTGSNNGDGFWWHIKYSSNDLFLRTEDNVNGESDVTGTPFVSTGKWYYLTTVVGTNTFKVYKDGVLYWSWTPNNGFSWTNLNSDRAFFMIGKSYYEDTVGVNGKVDDVRLYNYERTADQVLQDYNAGAASRLGAKSTGVADPWSGALPTAHWKLDENTGVLAKDASGNGYNGTITAGTWAQGKVGPGLSLNGSSSNVSMGDPASGGLDFGSGDFTMSAWIYINSLKDFNPIFQKQPSTRSAYEYTINSAGNFQWDATSCADTISLSSPFTAGSWQHIAVVNTRGSSITVYRNGVNVGSKTTCTTPSANAEAFSIGGTGAPYSGYFDGKIDDAKIYNYARTQAQIAWDYNAGKPVAQWRMDEATTGSAVGTNNIKDDSGNGYHGSGAGTNIAWTTGKFGGAMSFNGTDDYVRVNQTLSTPITASCWVKLTDFSKTMNTFINSYPHAVLGVSLNRTSIGDIYVYIGNGSSWLGAPGIISSRNMVVNKWHHVSYTCDGTTSTLYLDGVSVGSTNIAPSGWGSYFNFGGIVQGGEYLKGSMDDVRVYSYARTAEQVLQDYNQGLATKLGD